MSMQSSAISPDGKMILTGSSDNTARLWDAETARPVGPPLQHGDTVDSVAFSPDGRTVGTGSLDRTARLWDVAAGNPKGPPFGVVRQKLIGQAADVVGQGHGSAPGRQPASSRKA